MAILNHHTVLDGFPQRDGTRRLHHVFVDHKGVEHSTNSISLPADITPAELTAHRVRMVAKVEARQAHGEIVQYLSELRAGNNPFKAGVNPVYQTRGQAIKRVLKIIGHLRGSELLKYKVAFSFINNLSQAQIESLGLDWPRYQLWASRINNIKAADDTFITIEDTV